MQHTAAITHLLPLSLSLSHSKTTPTDRKKRVHGSEHTHTHTKWCQWLLCSSVCVCVCVQRMFVFQKQNKSAINAPHIATLHLKIQHSLFSQQPTPPTHAHVRHRPRHPHPPSNSQNAQTRLAKSAFSKRQQQPIHKKRLLHHQSTNCPNHAVLQQCTALPRPHHGTPSPPNSSIHHTSTPFSILSITHKQRKKAFCASHSQDGKNQM